MQTITMQRRSLSTINSPSTKMQKKPIKNTDIRTSILEDTFDWQSYSNLIFNIAKQKLGDLDDAEEVTQQTIESAIKSISILKAQDLNGFKSWLYKILMCEISKFIKKKQINSNKIIGVLLHNNVDSFILEDGSKLFYNKYKEVIKKEVNGSFVSYGKTKITISGKIVKINFKETKEVKLDKYHEKIDCEADTDREKTIEKIEIFIKSLKDKDMRNIVKAYFYKNKKTAIIAQELNIPKGTVCWKLSNFSKMAKNFFKAKVLLQVFLCVKLIF